VEWGVGGGLSGGSSGSDSSSRGFCGRVSGRTWFAESRRSSERNSSSRNGLLGCGGDQQMVSSRGPSSSSNGGDGVSPGAAGWGMGGVGTDWNGESSELEQQQR